MTVNVPAPKMGPVTEEELGAIVEWYESPHEDHSLRSSLDRSLDNAGVPNSRALASYVLVRALRAGVKLEDLL